MRQNEKNRHKIRPCKRAFNGIYWHILHSCNGEFTLVPEYFYQDGPSPTENAGYASKNHYIAAKRFRLYDSILNKFGRKIATICCYFHQEVMFLSLFVHIMSVYLSACGENISKSIERIFMNELVWTKD